MAYKDLCSSYEDEHSPYTLIIKKIARQADKGKGFAKQVLEHIENHHSLTGTDYFHVVLDPHYKGQRCTHDLRTGDTTIHLARHAELEFIDAANHVITHVARQEFIARDYKLNRTDYTVNKFHQIAAEKNPKPRKRLIMHPASPRLLRG